MQDELVAPFALLAQTTIKVHLLPLLQALRLTFGQISSHGEIGLWKIQGIFVISHNFYSSIDIHHKGETFVFNFVA